MDQTCNWQFTILNLEYIHYRDDIQAKFTPKTRKEVASFAKHDPTIQQYLQPASCGNLFCKLADPHFYGDLNNAQ